MVDKRLKVGAPRAIEQMMKCKEKKGEINVDSRRTIFMAFEPKFPFAQESS